MFMGLRDFIRFHAPWLPGAASTLPACTAILVGLLFGFVGQMHEIYLTMIEHQEYFRFLFGLFLIWFLCLGLNRWYLARTQDQIPLVYGLVSSVEPNRLLSRLRYIGAGLCGAAPLAGICWGLYEVRRLLKQTSNSYTEATRTSSERGRLEIPFTEGILEKRQPIEQIVDQSYLFLIFAGIALLAFGYLRLQDYKQRQNIRRTVRADRWIDQFLGALAVFGLIILPMLHPSYVLWISQGLGPLSMAALQCILILAILTILAWASKRTGMPWILLLLIFLGIRVYTSDSGAPNKATAAIPQSRADEPANQPVMEVADAFREWLKSRVDGYGLRAAPRHKAEDKPPELRFPVVIVASQGGGIYAATAAATFLAALQDRNPCFARHLFAVSGVSGGAVGAALFNATAQAFDTAPEYCAPQAPSRTVDAKTHVAIVRSIVSEDHLSPVLALLIPEYAEKLLWFSARKFVEATWSTTPRLTRASALEASLTCAFEGRVRREQGGGWLPRRCDHTKIKTGFGIPFDKHFSPEDDTPALVLNTTFAETGRRVAFAPFGLDKIGERALSSFTDAHLSRYAGTRKLAEAAVASARFPGLMPAFSIEFLNRAGQPRRWNFVDGGYADNSGASTAAAIYEALRLLVDKDEQIKRWMKDNRFWIDLRLVIITDEVTAIDVEEIRGTQLADTRAPIEALLNVRSSISSREINRTIERFPPSSKEAGAWAVSQLRLDQKNFSLRLGWTLSNTTNFLISLFTARPELCVRSVPPPAEPSRSPERNNQYIKEAQADAQLIAQNGCVLQDVLKLLPVPAGPPPGASRLR